MPNNAIMGQPVNPCINGITKAQATKINEIDGIKADIAEIEEIISQGSESKYWVELPYHTYSLFQPYINQLIAGDKTVYDMMIVFNDGENAYYSTFIPRNTNKDFYVPIQVISSDVYVELSFCYFEIENILNNVNSTLSTESPTIIKIDKTTSAITISSDSANLPRNLFRILIFATSEMEPENAE